VGVLHLTLAQFYFHGKTNGPRRLEQAIHLLVSLDLEEILASVRRTVAKESEKAGGPQL